MRMLVVALLLVSGSLAACGGSTPDSGDRITVVAGFYPLRFVAERVGGDRVQVTELAPPGAEPHDLELSPSQVGRLADADLVFYLRGFQPAVDEAVDQNAGDHGFDAGSVATPVDGDPHIWLDPLRLADVADALAARLAALDPAGGFADRAAALRTELTALDAAFQDGLATCERREIIVSHEAFGYLTRRYNLTQLGISGLSPEAEPTPARLAEVAQLAERNGATTIFFETLVSPAVAETLAREIGAGTAVLDPIEGLQPGSTGDYLSLMRANLDTLRPALDCA